MKKFGFATVVASGLAAAILGMAAPAQADALSVLASAPVPTGIDHHVWLDQIGPHVNVPQVDTSVRTRTVN